MYYIILKLIRMKLCDQNKYDKKVYEELTKQAIEEYENGLKKGMSKEESLEEMNKIIDLEINQLKRKSKFFMIMILSLCALLIASIESILLSFDFTFVSIEIVCLAVIWLGLFLYAVIFKKNKTKWDFSIMILFLFWLGSFITLEFSYLKCYYTAYTISVWEYTFPCLFKASRHWADSNHRIPVGSVPYSVVYDVYFNWIVSLIMSCVFVILYIVEKRNQKRK